MKRNPKLVAAVVTAVIVLLGCRNGARAQSRRASPHETTNTVVVDGSSMFIEYGRPYTRGRTIFGGLVRYNDVWCPGADEATMLSTSKPLKMGTLAVPAGEYSVWILPTETTWTLILNQDAHTFHTSHRASRDLGRVEMKKQMLTSPVEQLTFVIQPNAPGPGGRIAMSWATTEASVPFIVGE